jgi:ADP-ribose pyrophosphatase YjhB (NUDIX family)
LKLADDIVFDRGNRRFNYRVVGVAMNKGRVLLQQVKGSDHWFLPGGRGKLGEMAGETLKREMREELNTDIEVGGLVWVVENFFKLNINSYHELSLFFLMKFPDGSQILETDELGVEDEGEKLINKWHCLDALEKTTLFPEFLRTGLQNIPDSPQHIVNADK